MPSVSQPPSSSIADGAVPPTLLDLRGLRVFVAGHRGLVGAAIMRRLASEDCELVTDATGTDLRRQEATERLIAGLKPDVVVVAAARVGGIYANSTWPASFIYDNLAIAMNVIQAARLSGVRKLLNLGSSCVYPREAPQPIPEEALLTGPLEPTNEWYAIAKIAAIRLCDAYRLQHGCDFVSVMPTNLFGPGDNYDPESSHVPAALIRRFHEAKRRGDPTVTVWGTGQPRREFMYVDDLADAAVFVLKHWSAPGIVNVGVGHDITIAAFARLVADTVGYAGDLVFDPSRPDGMPRKLLDGRRLEALGWRPRTDLADGLARAYADFLAGGARGPGRPLD